MIIIDRGGIDFHTNVSGVLWLAELQDPEIKLSRLSFNVKYLLIFWILLSDTTMQGKGSVLTIKLN